MSTQFLLVLLSDIELLMSEHSGDVCLAGDWNTDPDRQTAQTVSFLDFIDRNGLALGWHHVNDTSGDTFVSIIDNCSLHRSFCTSQ